MKPDQEVKVLPANHTINKKAYFLIVVVILIVIGVGSYYLSQKRSSSPAVIARQTPNVVQSPTLTSDPTTSWNIYTNKLLGFHFKYPPSWAKDDLSKAIDVDFRNGSKGYVCVKHPEGLPYDCQIMMYLQKNSIEQVIKTEPKNMGLTEVDGDFGGGRFYPATTEIFPIIIDGKKGYKIKGTLHLPNGKFSSGKPIYQDHISYNILIPLNGNTLDFTGVTNDTEINQILSTFKFTSPF